MMDDLSDSRTLSISPSVELPSTHQEVRSNNPEWDPATCPLPLAINLIGGRWKLHILRQLMLVGPQRYNKLLGAIEGISAKELTRNIKDLEAGRIVEQASDESGNRYQLTPLGTELEPSMRELGIFGSKVVAARQS